MSRWPRPLRVALIAAAAVGLGLKVVLLASGTYQGFAACYRSPLEAPTTGPCERSFENPLFRFAVTRLDRAVHFGEHDWDLGFLNTVRFDRHYDGLQGRLRRRLPIEASWRGAVERPRPWVARVTYVGEATIRLDPDGPEAGRTSTTLPPHYGAPATALVPVPGGRHQVRIDYRFDDGSTWGGPRPVGPWATFQMERGRGPGGRDPGPPIRPIRPAWPWRAAAAAGDAAVALLAISILFFYVGLLWRDAGLLVLVAGAAPLADRLDPARLGLPGSLGLCLVLALVAGPVLGRRWRRRLVGAFFATLYVTWFVTLRTFRRLDVVTLRDWAGDPLFYESQARAILDTWSLEGGERIFLYQPLFRYIRFAERLLLGEGDGLVSSSGSRRSTGRSAGRSPACGRGRRPQRHGSFSSEAWRMFMLALVSTPPVVYFVQASLSEFPTWIFLLLLFPMLFASRSPVQWRAGSALASLSLLTRSNQAAGVLAQLGVFAWRTWSLRPRATLAALVLSALILALPSLHNLYYGGQLVLAGRSQPHLLKLPPSLWPRILHDPAVAKEALNQLDHVLYLNPVDDPPPRGDALSRLAIRGLQVLWAAACVLAIRRRGFAPGTKLLLVGLPVLYLGVHLVYVVDDYYPRHIIAGYLAMGLVTLNAVGRGWPRNGLPKPAA